MAELNCDRVIADIADWVETAYKGEPGALRKMVSTDIARVKGAEDILGRYGKDSGLAGLLAELTNSEAPQEVVRTTHLSAIRGALFEIEQRRITGSPAKHGEKVAA